MSAQSDTVRQELTAEHDAQIKALREKSHKALEKAEEKAHKLEHDAKQQAEEYLEKRKKEVEAELMDLVIKVTKKVLPEGLTYEAHKELVVQALRDVRTDKGA